MNSINQNIIDEKNISDIFNSNFLFDVSLTEIKLTPDSIYKAMGYSNSIPEILIYEVNETLSEIENYLDIKIGFKIFHQDKIKINSNSIQIDAEIFNSDKIITKRLRNSTAIAVFVSTAGSKITNYASEIIQIDPLKSFILDTIGSETAEQACDLLEIKLNNIVSSINWKITNRYSPGYCGWLVKEQQKLFSLLPKKFCGVSLTESSLMIPIKSVSGIIGLGPIVKKEEYECSICDVENCFRRR